MPFASRTQQAIESMILQALADAMMTDALCFLIHAVIALQLGRMKQNANSSENFLIKLLQADELMKVD